MTNNPILTDGLALVAGMIGGGLAELTFWGLRARRRRRTAQTIDRDVIDAETKQRLDDAASYWAAMHGRPHGRDVVARKLRLAYRLAQRQRARRWSR